MAEKDESESQNRENDMKIKIIPPIREDNKQFLTHSEMIEIEPLKVEIIDWSCNVPLFRMTLEQRKAVLDKAAELLLENIAILETATRNASVAVSEMIEVFNLIPEGEKE